MKWQWPVRLQCWYRGIKNLPSIQYYILFVFAHKASNVVFMRMGIKYGCILRQLHYNNRFCLSFKSFQITSGGKDRSESQTVTQEIGGFLQSPRTLRPQLGVGAVSKSPSAAAAKNRIFTAQKSPLALNQPVQAVTPSVTATSLVTPSTQSPPETSGNVCLILQQLTKHKWSCK